MIIYALKTHDFYLQYTDKFVKDTCSFYIYNWKKVFWAMTNFN